MFFYAIGVIILFNILFFYILYEYLLAKKQIKDSQYIKSKFKNSNSESRFKLKINRYNTPLLNI